MKFRALKRAVQSALLLGIATVAGATDDMPLPLPGLWKSEGFSKPYDKNGKIVTSFGGQYSHKPYCMTQEQSKNFYSNPLPTCQFNMKYEGNGISSVEVFCPVSGVHISVTNKVTATTIDTKRTETGRDGGRVESVEHGARIGDCSKS